MKMLAYYSTPASSDHLDSTLSDIYEASKRNNPNYGISGVLFFAGNHFLQVLEGPKENLNYLLEKIKQDKRHKDVQIIFESPIEHASLKDWNMNPLNFENTSIFSVEQIKKATELASGSMQLDADTFVFMVTELLEDDVFRRILNEK